MSIHIPLSLRPVLAGTIVLVLSACRRDERPDVIDTTTPPNDTSTSQNAPPAVPPELPSSLERERMQGEPYDRMPVAGRDDMIELGSGGTAGSSGTHTGVGGSAGHGGASAH